MAESYIGVANTVVVAEGYDEATVREAAISDARQQAAARHWPITVRVFAVARPKSPRYLATVSPNGTVSPHRRTVHPRPRHGRTRQ